MVLTEWDLDEIWDTMKQATEHLWSSIEGKYKKVVSDVRKGLQDLQVKTSIVQASVIRFQVSVVQPN